MLVKSVFYCLCFSIILCMLEIKDALYALKGLSLGEGFRKHKLSMLSDDLILFLFVTLETDLFMRKES